MILVDKTIKYHIKHENIIIDPFDPDCLGSNSYDLHLSEHVAEYKQSYLGNDEQGIEIPFGVKQVNEITGDDKQFLDSRLNNELVRYHIPKEGLVLYPKRLYLMSALEYTETRKHVPFVDGKSSAGRLGIKVHLTAGKGDVGFCGYWTLEVEVAVPVKVYKGMPIAQIFYFETTDTVEVGYNNKTSAKYKNQSYLPQGSKMFMNKF